MATIPGAWAEAWGGRLSSAGAPVDVTARASQPVPTATHIGVTCAQEDDYREKEGEHPGYRRTRAPVRVRRC